MQVYIEDAIVTQFVVNFLLIQTTCNMLFVKPKFWQKICSATFGVGLSFVTNLVTLPSLATVALKVLTGFILSAFIVKNFCFKQIFLTFSVLLASTFIMGGLVFAIQNLIQSQLSPIFATICVLVFSFVFKRCILQFYKKRSLTRFYYNIQICHSNKKFETLAYLDSGNLLQDETGMPVIILDFATFQKIFGVSLMRFLTLDLNKELKGKYVSFGTISNNSKIFVCDVDGSISLLPSGKILHARVGVGFAKSFAGDCHALLSPLVI